MTRASYPTSSHPRIGTARVDRPGVVLVKLSSRRTVAPKEAIARMYACDALRAADPSLTFTGADLRARIVAQADDARWTLWEVTLPHLMLTITLRDDVTSTADVAHLLAETAERIDALDTLQPGVISDGMGQDVGSWEVRP